MKIKIGLLTLLSFMLFFTGCGEKINNAVVIQRDIAFSAGIQHTDLNIDISTPEKLAVFSDVIVIGTVESDNDMEFPPDSSELQTKILLKAEQILKGSEYITDDKIVEFYSTSGYAKGDLYNKSIPDGMLNKYGKAPQDSYVFIQNANCIIPEKGDILMVFIKKDKKHFDYFVGFYEGMMYVNNNELFYNNLEKSIDSVDNMIKHIGKE